MAAGPDEASKLHNEAQAHTASSQKRRRHGNRVIRTTRVGRGSVPGVGGEVAAALALARRRWGLAVTCACVVRHCACVLAPPMGAIPSGGLHLLGRIARDQLGLNLPDRVFRLIGNKPRLGAGC